MPSTTPTARQPRGARLGHPKVLNELAALCRHVGLRICCSSLPGSCLRQLACALGLGVMLVCVVPHTVTCRTAAAWSRRHSPGLLAGVDYGTCCKPDGPCIVCCSMLRLHIRQAVFGRHGKQTCMSRTPPRTAGCTLQHWSGEVGVGQDRLCILRDGAGECWVYEWVRVAQGVAVPMRQD